MRWFYALKEGWKNRAQLKSFLKDPTKQIHSLQEITGQRLDNAHIAILVLDFDGVLAGHDALEPTPQAAAWLRELSQEIGEQRIAILSNKPKPERIRFFSQNFPSMFFVRGVRKKPYPDGLWEVANYKGVPPHRVALVDDRLLTGMLATSLCYAQGLYFYPPVRTFWRHPIKETFFTLLRWFERGLFRLI